MNKAIIIIITGIWMLCSLYFWLARANDYPYAQYAKVGAWVASALLLVSILLFIRQERGK